MRAWALMWRVCGIALVSCVGPAQAIEGPNDSELAALPPYCRAKWRDVGEAEQQRWRSTFGPNWSHMHHYCINLVEAMRAERESNPEMRKRGLDSARDGFRNHLQETEPTHVLRYEIFYNLGRVSARLGDNEEAIQAFQESIRLRPQYVASYASLSDLYRKMGRTKDARDTLDAGLARSPNAKGLERRRRELGGL